MSQLQKVFHKNLTNQLRAYKSFASKDEYVEFEKELVEFEKETASFTMKKQHDLFFERYGSMYHTIKKGKELTLLTEIQGILRFFKVLTLICIVLGGFFGLILVLTQI